MGRCDLDIDHINHANPLKIILREHNDIFSTPGYIFLAYPQELRYGASEDRACALRYSDLIPNARLKAFSGELVETEAEIARTEGRDYETAEVLLKKIKEERMKSGKTTNVILLGLTQLPALQATFESPYLGVLGVCNKGILRVLQPCKKENSK